MKLLIAAVTIALGSQLTFAKNSAQKSEAINLQVTEKGFEPNTIDVKPGTTVTLKVTRRTDSTCAKEIQIPSKKITKKLPLDQSVTIELGKLEKGEIRFACGMNMVSGQVIVH